MNDTKHTPTPWRVNDTDERFVVTDELSAQVDCRLTGGDYERDVANAAHIVRCVNAHDELVAALEEMCNGPLLIDDANASLQTREDAMRRYKQARAILAKVKP